MESGGSRDPNFGRFAFTVLTVALVIVVLGLSGIYYYFQAGGSGGAGNPVTGMFRRGTERLAANQVMLYYTKDGKQLVSTVANLGSTNLNTTDKAKRIVEGLVSGQDAAGMKSPIPADTKVLSVFVNDNTAIVNLSKEFSTDLPGGVDAELLAVYSIVNSLLFNLEGIEGVQLLIESAKMPTLRGHIDIETPLIANAAITRTN